MLTVLYIMKGEKFTVSPGKNERGGSDGNNVGRLRQRVFCLLGLLRTT